MIIQILTNVIDALLLFLDESSNNDNTRQKMQKGGHSTVSTKGILVN